MLSPLTPYQTFKKLRFFSSLDALRALSILPVIWHHSSSHLSTGILSRGHLGVHLFFAISGFLITTLLLREQEAHGQISLKAFYIRRSLRIFPLYYAVLLLYVGRSFLFAPDAPERIEFFKNLPAYLTYCSNWFVDVGAPRKIVFAFAWSLATEEQFYVLWPSVLRFSRSIRWGTAFMLGLLLLDQGVEFAAHSGLLSFQALSTRILSSIATPICLGSLGAIALDHERSFQVLWGLLGSRLAAPVSLLLLTVSLFFDQPPPLLTHLLMTLLVLSSCIREDQGLQQVSSNSWLRYLGSISYGMYLLHVSAITLAKAIVPRAFSSALSIYLVATVLTVGLAALSFRFFETPFLKLKARFH